MTTIERIRELQLERPNISRVDVAPDGRAAVFFTNGLTVVGRAYENHPGSVPELMEECDESAQSESG